MPRGADAVVMIEHTELIEEGAPASSCAAPPRPGNSSPTPAPTSRAARRCCGGARASARARSACWRPAGLPQVDVVRRPKVAVLSTGDELVAPGVAAQAGRRLRQQRRDHRRRRHGGRRRAAGLRRLSRRRGGAGTGGAPRARRLRHGRAVGRHLEGRRRSVARVVSQLGKPGILVHGVALKPGKPLCLAVVDDKPIVVLPGFPTSAIFTFHAFVAPVIRARAGLPPEAAQTDRGARAGAHRLRDRPQGIRAGVADRQRGRPGRVPDRQRLRRGDQLLAGRRLPRDRRAGVRARRRQRRRT